MAFVTQPYKKLVHAERASPSAKGCLPFTWAKPVGLPFGSVWANGKQISVLLKFRLGLALTICRNPYHLPKNLHDGDG